MIVASGASAVPSSALAAVPTLPTTACGRPASRQIAPSSATVVVLPLVPVTSNHGRSPSSRQASSSSPSTGTPRSRAAAITGASRGTPGLLTPAPARSSSSSPSAPRRTGKPGVSISGRPASTPATSSPRATSARPAASPERASPTTSHGPGGSGGRGGGHQLTVEEGRDPERGGEGKNGEIRGRPIIQKK